ncbi:MAG: flavin reductase family protein [Pseudomonadota bacterium]
MAPHQVETSAPPVGEPVDDLRAYRRALGSFATGVTVVTTATPDGRLAGLTVNSFASVSLEPPLVSWCLSRNALSRDLFFAGSHFAVNVLSVHQVDLVRHFAKRTLDKFGVVETTPGLGGAPLLPEVSARFECRNVGRYEGGDHAIHLGEVERYHRFDREPLVFLGGRFGRLADG